MGSVKSPRVVRTADEYPCDVAHYQSLVLENQAQLSYQSYTDRKRDLSQTTGATGVTSFIRWACSISTWRYLEVHMVGNTGAFEKTLLSGGVNKSCPSTLHNIYQRIAGGRVLPPRLTGLGGDPTPGIYT